jgi:glutathione S-transferase
MSQPVVHGASYSVYTRILRLVLAEKGVSYRLQEVDIFSEDGIPDSYMERQPFGKIPAFEHDGFCLFETGAIARYVDEVFPVPSLMPGTIEERARVNQIIGILDSYAYRCWVWDIYVEEDNSKIEAALPQAETCLSAIEELMTGDIYFIGNDLTLADLHALPMIAYLGQKKEGQDLLEKFPRWIKWQQSINQRPSVKAGTVL